MGGQDLEGDCDKIRGVANTLGLLHGLQVTGPRPQRGPVFFVRLLENVSIAVASPADGMSRPFKYTIQLKTFFAVHKCFFRLCSGEV